MATNWLDDCTIHNILQVTFYMTLKILLLVLLSMNWLMDCRIPNVVYILLATFYVTSGNCWKTSFPNEKVYKWIGKKMKTWTKTETSINGKPGLTVCVCVCEWSTYSIRRIKTEEKAKVIALVWGKEFHSFIFIFKLFI